MFLNNSEEAKVAIVSFGNPLREDDGVPEKIARDLEKERFLNADYYYGEPLNYLGKLMSYDLVFILDSVLSPSPEGTVKVFSPGDVSAAGLSTHSVSVPFVKKALAGIQVYIIGIVVKNRGYRDSLSDSLRDKYPMILLNVKEVMKSCF